MTTLQERRDKLIRVVNAILYQSYGFDAGDEIDLSDARNPQEQHIEGQSKKIVQAVLQEMG